MRAHENKPQIHILDCNKTQMYTHMYVLYGFITYFGLISSRLMLRGSPCGHFGCTRPFFRPKVPNKMQQMVLVTLVKNKVPEEAGGNVIISAWANMLAHTFYLVALS